MRLAAGGILALMAGLYVIARSYQETWPWLEWLRAFSEAGMVGGLADWFAVTALFRHPLGLPIPHTAVIPREKDRIGAALAHFVRGNFLTADLICKQARELQLVQRMAAWMTKDEQADKLAGQTLHMLPTALDALEKHDTHKLITAKFTEQLRALQPNQLTAKLLTWMLSENRYRQMLAPVLVQLASAISHNKGRIELAAGKKAPLTRVPLIGRISRAIAEDISERTAGSIEAKLIAASEDANEPLWDIIHEQLTAAQEQFESNPELKQQLEKIRDQWLDDPQSGELAERVWQQLRQTLNRDLAREAPKSVTHLAAAIVAVGSAIDHNPELAQKIETTLLDGIEQILNKHGDHIEAMIRDTIEEWDADTLMQKLEQQVGPDLQFIRINGTLIGGLVGVVLHALGNLIW
ncbi:hypothetical protein NT6N_18950 [Oceaniferula spumae]|uniref:DUF445 domain-containing protein n=1 Tax=Oceaniferula spumae TaxID=2979115 RepID=A0AAT9FLL0_9BACT